MLAVRVDEHGGPEVLRPVEVAAPDPGPGQVLVRHEVIGVNYVDTQHRAGAPYPVQLPLIPGIEAAGQVIGVGEGVEELREGDRVAYAGPMVGVYAEVAAVPQDVLVLIPDKLSSKAAAAVLLQGMTAHVMTHDVHHGSAGEWALVHAAAGGTGSLLVQFLLQQGVRVPTTASSAQKAQYLRGLGVDHVINAQRVDLVEAVRVGGLAATRARSCPWSRLPPNSSTRSSRSPAASSALSSSASGTCRAPTRRPRPLGEKYGESRCQPAWR